MKLDDLRPDKYLKYLFDIPKIFAPKRTKEILSANPTIIPHRTEAKEIKVSVYDYDADHIEAKNLLGIDKSFVYKTSGRTTWINIDGLRKSDVEAICAHYDIHPLVIEDILSINQRPKLDEAENSIFCLLNMLYYNEETFAVEQEQISIVLAKDVVISFQEDATTGCL